MNPTSLVASTKLLATDRKRLSWLLFLLPVLMLGGAGIGWMFSGTASRTHPAVKLAELFVRERNSPPTIGPLASQDFALERASNPERSLGKGCECSPSVRLRGVDFWRLGRVSDRGQAHQPRDSQDAKRLRARPWGLFCLRTLLCHLPK